MCVNVHHHVIAFQFVGTIHTHGRFELCEAVVSSGVNVPQRPEI